MTISCQIYDDGISGVVCTSRTDKQTCIICENRINWLKLWLGDFYGFFWSTSTLVFQDVAIFF